MTTAATIAAFRRIIALLAELGEDDATMTAQVLTRLLAGEAFESAAGLVPGWRSHQRLIARDCALCALVAMHTRMSDNALASWIVDGLARFASAGDVRPDGADGYLNDLARAGSTLSQRQWRRLIADARRVVHRGR